MNDSIVTFTLKSCLGALGLVVSHAGAIVNTVNCPGANVYLLNQSVLIFTSKSCPEAGGFIMRYPGAIINTKTLPRGEYVLIEP